MKTVCGVVIAHLAVVTFLICTQSPHQKKITRKQVVVKTYLQNTQPKAPKYLKLDAPISLLVATPPAKEEIKQPIPEQSLPTEPQLEQPKPEVVKSVEQPKKEVSVPPAPKAAPKPPPKVTPKTADKKPPPQKTAPAQTAKKETAPTPKAKTNPHQQKLISLMQESLHTLNTTGKVATTPPPTSPNKTVGTLASEALTFASHYEDALVSYLKGLLVLPEKGSVKLKLTVQKEGSVQEVVIVTSTSQKNRQYVESALASCYFPAFGSQFKGETAHTFTITLTSEDSR